MAPTITVADGEASGITASSTVAENSGDAVAGAAGAILGIVTLADADADDTHTVEITGDQADKFQVIDHMDAKWLTLKSGQSLDFEEAAEVKLTLTVTDSGTPAESGTAEVTITVTDVNEPVTLAVAEGTASGITASFSVDENSGDAVAGAAGAILGIVTVTDPDAGPMPAVTVNDPRFQVIDHMGAKWLTLKSGESLDYEAENADGDPTIALTLTVTDAGGLTATAAATITVNDVNEAPVADAEVEIDDATFVSGEEGSMEVDLKALFSDPDGDTLTYKLADSAPEWLELSVTTKGDGSITGTVSGEPKADADDLVVEGVSILASDGDDDVDPAEASFDVVLDAKNDKPTRLELLVEDDDGVVERVRSVEVDENVEGEVLGRLRVTDKDDGRHPHGQHEFSFESGGKADGRFEARQDAEGGWWLALKEGESLDFEDSDEIVLEVTATDNKGAEDDEARESVSAEITIKVDDVDAGDGPTANRKIGDWWVTVDDNLDADEVRKGEWLSFELDTTGSDAAFTDADGDKLTYSVRVTDAGGARVDWLEISSSGKMANKAETLPEEGVYTVTVTATDDDDNSREASFKLAVALSDFEDGADDGDGNDGPDIRDEDDFDYEEGSGAQKVASFSVNDDDIAIAPHPYGVLHVDFSATQKGDGAPPAGTNVKNRLKLVEVGRDEDSVDYEIWTKSADELAVGDDGKKLKTAYKPLDFEKGDEVEIDVMVWDNFRYKEVNDKIERRFADDSGAFVVSQAAAPPAAADDIKFDIVDADDTKPDFDADEIHGADAKRAKTTTTITVDQEGAGDRVIVVPLEDAWSDDDTDSDELVFGLDDKDLPDWIKVYGPDQWEDIYERRRDVDDDDAPSGLRDSEMAVAIVIDRTADGDNVGTDDASFTLTATDGEGNKATETIKIEVTDTNVAIPEDAEDVVEIVNKDEANGLGSLTMRFNQELDPDFAGDAEPELVLYTWSTIAAGADGDFGTDDDVTTVIMVSSTPQPLPLDAGLVGGSTARDGQNDFGGLKIKASVEYYEKNPPPDNQIDLVSSEAFTDETAVIKAADEDDEEASAMFDFTTNAENLLVRVTLVNGPDTPANPVLLLQSSKSETGGWQTHSRATPDSLDGSSTTELAIDADRDGTNGDGGGLYYRVMLNYGSGRDAASFTSKDEDMVRLGQLAGDAAVTNIRGGDAGTDVPDGTRLQVDIGDYDVDDVDFQWQFDPPGTARGWADIPDATGLSIRVTDVHADGDVRAKVIYKGDDNPATRDVNEKGWPVWIEYTEVIGVAPAPDQNDAPEALRGLTSSSAYEVLVKPEVKPTGANAVQPGKVHTFFVKDLFFDNDGDSLSYTITSVAPTLNEDLLDQVDGTTQNTGYRGEMLAGNQVYRGYTTTIPGGNPDDETEVGEDGTEHLWTLAIDDDGKVTFITSAEEGHNGGPTGRNSSDGGGNALVLLIRASDARSVPEPDEADDATTAEAYLHLRINAAPTSIHLQSLGTDGTPIGDGLEALPAEVMDTNKGTPLMVEDGTDADTDPDLLTFMDDVEQDARIVANIDVRDLNLSISTNPLGTHDVKLSGKGKDQFEVVETRDADSDSSTWQIRLKDDAVFDFDKLATSAEKKAGDPITLSITLTATDDDGSDDGLSTTGVFSVVVMNDPDDDAKPPAPKTPPKEDDPEVEGLEDDGPESDDDDIDSEDGPAIPPPDGGAFLDQDDLLGDFVLAIDDGIDIA
ncbi:MAG: cadherin domain-containing protein [Gammaproteobacteria bacterium]|nr:cadherin domain-containing protein [Gammaproteobacteria bacterium]